MPPVKVQATRWGVDAWEDVPGVFYHGTGEFNISEEWFTGKTGKYSFRFTDVVWMDYRGVIPASLWNKTDAAVRGLKYVHTRFSGTRSGAFNFLRYASQQWQIQNDPNPPGCTVAPPVQVGGTNIVNSAATDNHLFVYENDIDLLSGTSTNFAEIAVDAAGMIGPPLPLLYIPDGCTILEARAEVMTTALTRTRTTPAGTDTTVTDISYAFVGFTGPTAFEVIGTIPGASEGQRIVDITSVVQTMYAERASGKYAYGYGCIFSPLGLTGAGVADIESLIPAGPPPYKFVEDEGDANCGGFYAFDGFDFLELRWGSVSFGNVVLKIDYPEMEYSRQLIQPRWPSQV